MFFFTKIIYKTTYLSKFSLHVWGLQVPISMPCFQKAFNFHCILQYNYVSAKIVSRDILSLCTSQNCSGHVPEPHTIHSPLIIRVIRINIKGNYLKELAPVRDVLINAIKDRSTKPDWMD
jgi:hypothetical protein